jgi:actin-related protein
MYTNIIISGGNTLFPGFIGRFEKELFNLIPPGDLLRILAPPERKHSAWLGGSIYASLEGSGPTWMTRGQYEEHGAAYVHRVCF